MSSSPPHEGIILIDEEEQDPILDFNLYCDAIVKIINASSPRFSIGIYSEWGTGKTTLMRMVQRRLTETMFRWDFVPGEDEENLIRYLSQTQNLEWIRNSEVNFEKLDSNRILKVSSKNSSDSVSFEIKDKNSIVSWLPFIHDQHDHVNLSINGMHKETYHVQNGRDSLVVDLYQRNEAKVLTVWFNAWRYELEERYALVALMKTIAYAMGDDPSYRQIKPIILRGLEIFTKGALQKLATDYVISEKGAEDFAKKLTPKMEFLSEMDRDTIYFDGIRRIEKELRQIRLNSKDNHTSHKVVVFIDDLDRCSPRTVLDVFESVKVFLGIEGFVYIMGLSERTIARFIKAEYEKVGISDAEYIEKFAEQYINKIIQIPIQIPEWNISDITKLIKRLSSQLDDRYKKIISDNVDLIAKVVENNPREAKRFINNFIIAFEIYSAGENVKPKELLLVQALKSRWNNVYRYVISSSSFRDDLKKYLPMSAEKREDEIKARIDLPQEYKDFMSNVLVKPDYLIFWEFLKGEKDAFLGIKDWNKYRRAAESVKEDFARPGIVSPVEDATTWISKGSDLMEAGKYDEALKCFDRAIQLDPGYINAWTQKGRVLERLEKYDEAMKCYDRAIEIEPTNAFTLIDKALLLERLEKYDEAMMCYDRAIEIVPTNAFLWVEKMSFLLKQDKYDEAMMCYHKAIELEPNNPDNWVRIGHIFSDSRRYNEAIEAYSRATELEPSYHYNWTWRGDAFLNLQRYPDAIQAFDRAIELNPNDEYSWTQKGFALEKSGKNDEALEAYNRAIEINPDNQYALGLKSNIMNQK